MYPFLPFLPFLPFGEVANGYVQAFRHAAGQVGLQPLARGQEQGAGSKPAKETLLINAFGPVCRVHKVSGILVVDGKLVLLNRRDKDPDGTDRVWYEPFGGKPDYNYENPQGLLLREGQEELGITVRVGECLGIAQHPKFRNRTVAYFKCECPKGRTPKNMAPDEHLDVVFLSPEDLQALIDQGEDIQLPSGIVEEFIRTGDVTSLHKKMCGPFASIIPPAVLYLS